jgi:hypothetical protein
MWIKKDYKVPHTDDEVEKHFCTRELGTSGQALFGISHPRTLGWHL